MNKIERTPIVIKYRKDGTRKHVSVVVLEQIVTIHTPDGYTSTQDRSYVMEIPSDKTNDDVMKAINPNAVLFRTISFEPIMPEYMVHRMEACIELGLVKLEDIAKHQLIRYPEGHEKAGDLILKDGKPQYRKIQFHNKHRDDVDLRT